MKKSLLILLGILIYSFGYSQNVKITKGNISKNKYGNTPIVFIEPDGHDGWIVLRSYLKMFKGGGYILNRVDSKMNVKQEYMFKLYSPKLEGMFVRDGKVYLLEVLKKNKKYKINILSSPIEKFKFKSKQLTSVESKKVLGTSKIPGTNLDIDRIKSIFISKNKNFFVTSFCGKDKSVEKHYISVYNDKFEKIYSHIFNKKIKTKLFEIQEIKIDDKDATIYLLAKAFENGKTKLKYNGKPNYHYELYKIDKTDRSLIKIKAGKHFIKELALRINKDMIVAAGLYSDKTEDKVKGVCRINVTKESYKLEKVYFINLTKQYYLDKYNKVKKKETKSLELSYVFLDESGDVVINGEENSASTFFIDEMGGRSSQYLYMGSIKNDHTVTSSFTNFSKFKSIPYLDDILSAKIDRNGKVIWMRNIKKHQPMTKHFAHSFASYMIEGKNYIFLNSRKFKKEKHGSFKFSGVARSRSSLFLLEISDNGTIKNKTILAKANNKITTDVINFYEVPNENKLIFHNRKKKKAHYTMISF